MLRTNVCFDNATLNSTFSGTTLTSVDFEGATIQDCMFKMAVIHDVRLPPKTLIQAIYRLSSNLSGLDLSGREFSDGLNLSTADFTGANLSGSTLYRCNFYRGY